MPSSRSVKFALLGAGLCAIGAAASCSEDGVTTSCPALPLYQTFPLGDASRPDATSADTPENEEALAAAINAGCATGPSSSTAGTNGAGASAGTSGTANKGGASSGGSTNNADNAGSTGRD